MGHAMTPDAPTEDKPLMDAVRLLEQCVGERDQAKADLAAAREELATLKSANGWLREAWKWHVEENVRLREAAGILWRDYNRPQEADPLDYVPGLRDLQEAADARVEVGPIDRIKAALAGGDNPVGDVVKWARKVVGAPAGPLPSELVEALKGLDGALADLDGAAK